MPSPPSPEASGSTTPSANETAIAASTMLPPRSSASAPARDASGWPDTTTARSDDTSGLISGCSATIASMLDSSAASSSAAAPSAGTSRSAPATPQPTNRKSSTGAAASPRRDRRRRQLAIAGRRCRNLARAGVHRQRRIDDPQPKRVCGSKERRWLVGIAFRVAVVRGLGRWQVRRSRAACHRVTTPGRRRAVRRAQQSLAREVAPVDRRRSERAGGGTSGSGTLTTHTPPAFSRTAKNATRELSGDQLGNPSTPRTRARGARALTRSPVPEGFPPPRGHGPRLRFRDPICRRSVCRRERRAPAARRLQSCPRREVWDVHRPGRRRVAASGLPIGARRRCDRLA